MIFADGRCVITRSLSLLFALTALSLLPASAAAARGHRVGTIVSSLKQRGAYIDRAAHIGPKRRTALIASARQHHVNLVVLAHLPRGIATAQGAARTIARRLDDGLVAVAVRNGKVAVAPLGLAGVESARSAAKHDRGVRGLLRFAGAYAPAGDESVAASAIGALKARPGGQPIWIWVLVIAGAAVLLITTALLLPAIKRRRVRKTPESIADGMELLRRRASQLAKAVQYENDAATERHSPNALRVLARAGEMLTDTRTTLLHTLNEQGQRKAHSKLDEAEWQLEASRAFMDGTQEPIKPVPGHPGRCFFDGEHGLATCEIELHSRGQSVPVRVCIADALRLARYEEMAIGFVRIGGDTIPWPSAPTWLGAYDFPAEHLKTLTHAGQPVFEQNRELTLEANERQRAGAPHGSETAPAQ